MKLHTLIQNGEIPSFEELKAATHDPRLVWHIRMAAFGSLPDAIESFNILLGESFFTWTVSYDNSAIVASKSRPDLFFRTISLSPGHALILSVLEAAYAEDRLFV